MNFLAFTSGLIAIGSILLGNFVYSRNLRNSINKIYYLLMISVSLWAFVEFQLTSSTDMNSFLFWDTFDIFWVLTITILFHFSLVFTESFSILNNKYSTLFIYGIAVFFMAIHHFFIIETNAVLLNGIWYSDYSGINSILNNLIIGFFSIVALISLIICIKFYFDINDKQLRKKTLFIIIGIAIPVIGGIVIDGIGSIFFPIRIPISTIHLIVGTNIFFSYAIWRYDVFSVDVDNAAKDIVSMMSDALILVNKNKKIKMINATSEKLSGYKEKELFGRSIDTLLPYDLQKNVFTDDFKDVDLFLKTKYGKSIPVSVSSAVIRKNKDIRGYVIVCRDITERKKSEEETTTLASIVKHSSELVNLATLDGRMIFLNNAGSKMLGIELDAVHQFNIMQVIPPHLIDLVQRELLPAVKNGGSWKGDLQYKNLKNGEIVDVHAMTFLINDPHSNRPLYLANVSLDIREQKKSEKELKHAKKLLEEMNAELEKKVEERTEEIIKLLKQKDDFINQLGHDLKNPLGPLINLLPILEKREKNPKYQEMFQVLNRNINYMKNLVVKTIKLAKLNSPTTKFHLEETNLNDLIEEIISANSFLFQEKSITVINNITSSVNLKVDALQIQELFMNLFTNAVKYSECHGKIIVDASLHADNVVFSLRDTGMGMTDDQIQHVFDEFYKADVSRHDFDSSGLGMPIAKRIVEKHGGRIWAESQGLGNGSTIYFSLPFQPTIVYDEEDSKEKDSQDIGSKVDLLLSK